MSSDASKIALEANTSQPLTLFFFNTSLGNSDHK